MKNKKRISVGVVVFISVFVSLLVAVSLLIYHTGSIDSIVPKSNQRVIQFLDAGKPEEALAEIAQRSLTEQGSDSSLLMQGKAWYLLAWKRYDDAGWESYASNADDWFLGNDVDNALHALSRALESNNTWADATVLISTIYSEKGWYKQASRGFNSVLFKYPNHRNAYLQYAVTLTRQHKFASALRQLLAWPEASSDADFLKNIFWIYRFYLLDPQLALEYGDLFLKNAVRGNPDIPRVKRELLDVASRFPEYVVDTMLIYRERPPEFTPRRH